MASLRRATRGNIGLQDISEVSTDTIRVEFDDEATRSIEPVIDEYPFAGQIEHQGIIYYQEPSSIPGFSADTEEINFQYREESGLLIIQGGLNETKTRAVIQKLNQRLEETTDDIFMSISFGRLNLWSFVFSATNQTQLVVKDKNNNELSHEDINELTREELAQDYSLERARVVFYHDEERINVSYESGILNFTDSVSSDGREYVLQLFEKYVVDGNVLEEFRNIN